NGSSWHQQAYLKASNAAAAGKFGEAVALSGDTLAVGAPGQGAAGSGPGAAYVFVRNGNAWSEQAYLTTSSQTPQAYFGDAIAIDGDTIAVGAYGHGRVEGASASGPG